MALAASIAGASCAPPAASGAGTAGAPAAREAVTVVFVLDGDTLIVGQGTKRERVRLIGIDTPELGRGGARPEPHAAEATYRARALAEGQPVELERDPEAPDRDHYGRLLRYVWLPDGRLLNAEMIREGHATAMDRFPHPRLDEFLDLERQARRARVGRWAR